MSLSQIVEELEDRLGNQLDDVLDNVRSSLTEPAPAPTIAPALRNLSGHATRKDAHAGDVAWEDYQANEVVFDDTGEGQGVEGDLDVDDD